jgi:hypothetical protein
MNALLMKRAIGLGFLLVLTVCALPTSYAAGPAKPTKPAPTRVEKDLLGEKAVPADAYCGVQTARALENFQISNVGMNFYPEFVDAFAMVKLAAARANTKLGTMKPERLAGILPRRTKRSWLASTVIVSSPQTNNPFFQGGEIFAAYMFTGELHPTTLAGRSLKPCHRRRRCSRGDRERWKRCCAIPIPISTRARSTAEDSGVSPRRLTGTCRTTCGLNSFTAMACSTVSG